MNKRFDDRARRVLTLAEEEARTLGHHWLGTEHLLLGIIREGDGPAARALMAQQVNLGDVRARPSWTSAERMRRTFRAGFRSTPRSKTVLAQSLREALRLGHNYIGDGHILLALLTGG